MAQPRHAQPDGDEDLDAVPLAVRSLRVQQALRSSHPVYHITVAATGMLKELWIRRFWRLHPYRRVPVYQVFTYDNDPRDDTVERLADWFYPALGVGLSDEAIMATAMNMGDPYFSDYLFGLAAYLRQHQFPAPETLPFFINVENWLVRRLSFDRDGYNRSVLCLQRLTRKNLPVWRKRRAAVMSLIASTTFLADDLKPIVFDYVG